MKNTKLPSLNALRVFDVAARSGSFKQASQELGVTQSAVTRQIQTLEEQL
ncbi:LysR family transcriptional regulator, partial [Pantoea sp. SIMBA_072]